MKSKFFKLTKLFYFTLIIAITLAGTHTLAFSTERCGTLFPQTSGTHPPYYSPIYITTMVPSTISYVSSIGPCSMYGEAGASRARMEFTKESLVSLKIDTARGQGEYLNALAALSGCPENQFQTFSSVMQSEFAQLFSEDPSAFLDKIDSLIQSHSNLKNSCAKIN